MPLSWHHLMWVLGSNLTMGARWSAPHSTGRPRQQAWCCHWTLTCLWANDLPDSVSLSVKECPSRTEALSSFKNWKNNTRHISIFAISVRNAFETISMIMGTDRSMLFSIFLPLGYSRKLICFINVYAQQSVVTRSFTTVSTTVTHEKCHCTKEHGVHRLIEFRD